MPALYERVSEVKKRSILFCINQLFKGGAETALVNLLHSLDSEKYEVDLLIFDQINIPGSVDLLDQIPEWVNVFNAAAKEQRIAYFRKACYRIYRDITKQQLFRTNAVQYVKRRRYNVAVSFGEWFSSVLVAKHANAERKYLWIHSDMDKASFVYPDIFEHYQEFDRIIFASEQSKTSALKQYPMFESRSVVVHNQTNDRKIKAQSISQKVQAYAVPVLVTVANIRPEKNHIRQVEVMRILKNRGVRFKWINIGNQAAVGHVQKVKKAIREAGLEEDFLLPGAMENPYAQMKTADAVCVLSDHESWSMVITEAKVLGIPVIATKTSGAIEQIQNNENGILCDFSAEAIADRIQEFLGSPALQKKIRKNLEGFSSGKEAMGQLGPLLDDDRKKLLFVFDDINYKSGARNAALLQLEHLRQDKDVFVFTGEPCLDAALSRNWKMMDLAGNQAFRCLSVPCGKVLQSREYRCSMKMLRILYAVMARLGADQILYQKLLNKKVRRSMENFDTVCVLSEGSKFRAFVSQLTGPRKIQWIHTDYAAWSQLSSWTRGITARDEKIYRCYDAVVCLSERLKERFLDIYPDLREKVAVIPNPIDTARILQLAEQAPEIHLSDACFNMITIGRMEKEKRYESLLQAAQLLKENGVYFHWYFVGGGVLLDQIKELCIQRKLEDVVSVTGAMENPYPLLKQSDLLVLLSEYEGTPVTIDEAQVLGVPVLAANVGGIADQLQEDANSVLVEPKDLQAAVEALLGCIRKGKKNKRTNECRLDWEKKQQETWAKLDQLV